MKIDYQSEYNTRLRVLNYQEYFDGWARDAKAYRDEMAAQEGRAELGVSYGPSERQYIDLFYPEDASNAPIALYIHGGYWRVFSPRDFSHAARGLVERGVIVGDAGYDLCPQVAIRDIIDQMRKASLFMWERFGKKLLVYGHSCGGHLTACMLATEWTSVEATAPSDLVPAGYSISGLFDLLPFTEIEMNADLRLTPEEARRISPVLWPSPRNRILDAVVGGDEASEYLRNGRIITQAWRDVELRHEEIPGENHFSVIAPLADPKSPMVDRLCELSRRVQPEPA